MLLTENKPTTITFDLSIDGTKSAPSSVRLNLGENPTMVFEAEKQDDKWTCSFTPPSSLGKQFPVSIDVIVNGTVFTPYKSIASFGQTTEPVAEATTPTSTTTDQIEQFNTRVMSLLSSVLKTEPNNKSPDHSEKLKLKESKVKLGAGIQRTKTEKQMGIAFTKGKVIYK